MKNAEMVTFGGSSLERAAHLRDADSQEKLFADPKAAILPMWRGKPALRRDDHGTALQWVAVGHSVLDHLAGSLIFLGLQDDDTPVFAADVSAWEPEGTPEELDSFLDPSLQQHPDLPMDTVFAELRGVMTELTPRDAELAATARAMAEWHRSHKYCANCGALSRPAMAGWQRNCGACGRHHFPRTDPVVIMLITHGNSVLLGRSPGWPEKMYSLLAGFIEPGETMEAAVRREVFEEAGVRVDEVSYLASQPWPFPASLMFGCAGVATTTEITIDPEEIADAKWVSKETLLEAFAGNHPGINPARKGAIAHFLLSNWLADRLY